MTAITSYLYDNTIVVQILDLDPSITTRYRTVYNRPIKIYKGIDNPLRISVKNQDQKSVDVSGYNIQLDIQDPTQQLSIAQFDVNMANASVGYGSVTIDKDTVDSLEQRIYKLTLKRIDAITLDERPLYVDDNFGAQLDLIVLPAWYPNQP